ncbi:MAG: efflux RND transporter periplasmic adaptor subunit [Burkholderiales bacterium]
MKRLISILTALVLLGVATAAGYWFGANKPGAMVSGEGKIGVGRIGDSRIGESRVGETPIGKSEAAAASTSEANRKILYYRNPMGLPDTSPMPKKDAMGMDYTPVYEDETEQGPGVKISPEKMQRLGVRTEAVALRDLSQAIRAVGTVQVDERLQYTVAPRFEGWIQRLQVASTAQSVTRGQALMEVYGPDVVAAQQEYLVAVRGVEALKDASPEMQANMRNLVEGSLQRLRNWDIDEAELTRLREQGRASNTITLRSPASGVVVDKPAVQGMRFMPGEVLYKIADLSSVWLLADIFEQDIAMVRMGQVAKIRVNAYPERMFQGRVAFIYPSVNAESRTVRARIELANPGLLLKPSMYANVELAAGDGRRRLAVPDSAVLDSGTRQMVLVRRGEGSFEPREVRLGLRGDAYVEALQGLKAGEEVVVSANFLIDAESNLRAAIAGFGQTMADSPPRANAGRPAASATPLAGGGAQGKAPVNPHQGH